MNVTIYLADDHPIVVEGLTEILNTNSQFQVVGVAHNGEQLLSLLAARIVDLVVLDINMPVMDGIKCTQQIKRRFPGVKVIILTMYPEKTFADELITAGADGCMLKSRGSKELIDAIDRVMSGRSYFDWISDFKSGGTQAEKHRISDREREIIKLVVSGKTSSEIAELLFISEETVKTHRKNIFKKLDIHHITDLMTFAINNGLT